MTINPVKGDQEVIKMLKKLDPKNAKQAIRKGTREGAKVVQQKAKQLAPEKTGTLKKNIKVRAIPRNSQGAIGSMAVSEFRNTEGFYGHFQEFGWKTKSGRTVPGKHFMQQAGEEMESAAIQKTQEEIKNWINKNV